MSFRLRPEAEADIEAIVRTIVENNPAAARRWLDEILKSCRRLGEMPGQERDEEKWEPVFRTHPALIHWSRSRS